MLDGLRKLGRTWIGKVIGAFLLVGLAGFGISNVLLDFGVNTVARVGDQDISALEFQRAYNDDLNSFTRQIGRMPTPQEALQFGIPSGTLSRLASNAAVNQLGERMGLGVSEDRLGKMLREDPTFAGTLGQFDPRTFGETLRRAGFTEAEYFELQTEAARRQQLFAGLFADSPAPAAAADLLARFTSDTRTLDYIVLNSQNMLPVEEPTEDELAAYLAANQTRFRTQETRSVDIVVLTLDTLAATQDVTEAEIVAEYERTRASRTRVERRTIVQAPLAAAQKEIFDQGLVAGRGFDELVAETGLSLSNLGALSRAEITDAGLADAAFRLDVGGFAVIPGIGGSRVVAVTAIEPGGEVALDEVRDDIDRQLRNQKARDNYLEILDQIEELRAAFQPLAQIAERFGLPVQRVALTAGGPELAGIDSIGAENRGRVAAAAFSAREDQLSPTVAFSANNNVWVDLVGVEAARDQTLDEVRDAVQTAIMDERTRDAMNAEVERLLERLRGGEPFSDVALSISQFPTLSQPITRSGDGTPVIDQTVGTAAFSGGEGYIGSAINGDGDHVIFHVVEIQEGAPGADVLAQQKAFLDDGARQSLYADFITGLRDEAGLRVNRQTLDQILALDATGQ